MPITRSFFDNSNLKWLHLVSSLCTVLSIIKSIVNFLWNLACIIVKQISTTWMIWSKCCNIINFTMNSNPAIIFLLVFCNFLFCKLFFSLIVLFGFCWLIWCFFNFYNNFFMGSFFDFSFYKCFSWLFTFILTFAFNFDFCTMTLSHTFFSLFHFCYELIYILIYFLRRLCNVAFIRNKGLLSLFITWEPREICFFIRGFWKSGINFNVWIENSIFHVLTIATMFIGCFVH